MDLHWLPPDALHGKGILLDGEEAHHILKVRRYHVGDEIHFTDGDGRLLRARIDRIETRTLHAELLKIEEDPRERSLSASTLALALLKGDHFELALEKCVELGVGRIVPLLADHCVVRWKESSGSRKRDRWRRIAIAAMKQSGRTRLPEILAPVPTVELHEHLPSGLVWVAGDETEARVRIEDLSLPDTVPRLALVGPEGGFSDRERLYLAEQGAHAVTLSPFRLRAETAAVVLVAALTRPSAPSTEPS